VDWSATGLAPGEYQGILRIRGARSGVETRVPYWYAVPSNQPQFIHVITSTRSTPYLYMRAVDQSGVVISDVAPAVTAVSGGGSVAGAVQSLDSLYPGYWRVRVQLSSQGASVFRVEFGPASTDVTVRTGG